MYYRGASPTYPIQPDFLDSGVVYLAGILHIIFDRLSYHLEPDSDTTTDALPKNQLENEDTTVSSIRQSSPTRNH